MSKKELPRRPYVIRVCSGDLLRDCPLDDHPIEDVPLFPWSRFYDLRYRWSHCAIELAAPVGKADVPHDEIALQWQMLAYHACRSPYFWKVVGPATLMEELAELPTTVWGRYGASLYLCQHEIRGD